MKYVPLQDIMNLENGEIFQATDSQGQVFLVGRDAHNFHIIDPNNYQIEENGQINLVIPMATASSTMPKVSDQF